jgi:hypothetical protein
MAILTRRSLLGGLFAAPAVAKAIPAVEITEVLPSPALMPSSSGALSELVTTTLRNHSREIASNISDNNALLRYLRKKGQIVENAGGCNISGCTATADDYSDEDYEQYDDYEDEC